MKISVLLVCLSLSLVGCSSEPVLTPQPREAKWVLFPSCLKGKTLDEASKYCVAHKYDWSVSLNSSAQVLQDIENREEGLVILDVNGDGIVTNAGARFKKLEHIVWTDEK